MSHTTKQPTAPTTAEDFAAWRDAELSEILAELVANNPEAAALTVAISADEEAAEAEEATYRAEMARLDAEIARLDAEEAAEEAVEEAKVARVGAVDGPYHPTDEDWAAWEAELNSDYCVYSLDSLDAEMAAEYAVYKAKKAAKEALTATTD